MEGGCKGFWFHSFGQSFYTSFSVFTPIISWFLVLVSVAVFICIDFSVFGDKKKGTSHTNVILTMLF